jgi:hypothetical protein
MSMRACYDHLAMDQVLHGIPWSWMLLTLILRTGSHS